MTTKVLQQLIESPWEANELLPPLSDADRAAIRAALLEKIDGDKLESGVPAALRSFADAEVLAALQRVLAMDVPADVREAAAESIATIAAKLPAARAALRELIEHADSGVARIAIESLDDITPALLPILDSLAARGDDSLMSAIVEQLARTPTPAVIAALARHWSFAIIHGKTLVASNLIFDTLIDHAPRSTEAQAAFAAAAAHGESYAKVRGFAALALTTDDILANVKALNALKGLKPSGSSLRKSALAKLAVVRRADLEKLAAAGNKTAAKLLG